MYVFLGFMTFLTVSLWLGAVWFATFAVRLIKRQDALYQALSARMTALEAALTEAVHKSDTTRASLTQLSIPMSEPIAKYKDLTLPDDVNVHFVGNK